MFKLFKAWRAREKARTELYGMTDRELRDIGITRVDIRRLTA